MKSTAKGDGAREGDADGAPESAENGRSPTLQAIVDLRHPHVATMRRSSDGVGFELEGTAGLTLVDLARSADGERPLALRMSVRILLDALSGLAALHRAKLDGKPIGFVHGEVAPHNIVVGRDGIGRLVPVTPAHWSMPPVPAEASLGYVAPERLLGDVFDQRADVFSIGVLLWEAIAQTRLFQNMRMDSIVTKLVGNKVSRPPAPPDAPWAAALTDVALQALAVDPAERWPHVGVLGAEIETIAEGCLASSEEIALFVRHRLGEKPASLAPRAATPSAMGSVAPSAPAPSTAPRSAPKLERASSEMANVARPSVPPASGLVMWHGPRSGRTPASSRELIDSGRRTSPEVIVRQSRIVWTAVGVGLALFAIAAYELTDRDPPPPFAAEPTAQSAPEPAAAHAAEPPHPPPVAAPRDTTPPKAPDRSRPASDARHETKQVSPAPAAAPRTPSAPRVQRTPPPPPAQAPPPPPAPTATPPAASAPEPPPSPPPPKPREDPFGI